MLRNVNDLRGFEIYATDGELGSVTEFYFDDRDWTILYMVLDTGNWLPGKRVLISPIALGDTDWVEKRLEVMLTKEEVEESPDIDLHQPITREQEVTYFSHFGWPCLWEGELRSTNEVVGHQVEATDGLIGSVADLLIDENWIIRYLIVDAQDQGKKVLLSPRWIERVNWTEPKIYAALNSESIKKAPGYDPSRPIKREHEARLYGYYGLSPYWS